jgi:thiol-disulfide isomerase/thioredoxin
MSSEILSRALLAFVIAGSLVGVYWLVNKVIISRARGKRLGLETIQTGVPAILYFTTPFCVPCRTVQRPALARLMEQQGDALQVIEIDASQQPELANYWGVLSVPTTFVIDSKGRPRRVNHGIASAEKLGRQIEEVEQLHNNIRRYLRKFQDKRNYST